MRWLALSHSHESGIYRNIGGSHVFLRLITVDPCEVRLDINNPRISHSLHQLPTNERTDSACELLLCTQEDIDTLKLSIVRTKGVQEPIYIKLDNVVVEGNRRVVALRELMRQQPENPAYNRIPAWVLPQDTSITVIDELIHSAHLDPKRPWSPYERALVLMRLSENGLDDITLAERYEMKRSEILHFIEAATLMIRKYLPLLEDPDDPDVKTKFSYFLEYVKGRMTEYRLTDPSLDDMFCRWVRDGKIPKAEAVRRLPKMCESTDGIQLIEDHGFNYAWHAITMNDPSEDKLFGNIINLIDQMQHLSSKELSDIRSNSGKIEFLNKLDQSLKLVLDIVDPKRRRL